MKMAIVVGTTSYKRPRLLVYHTRTIFFLSLIHSCLAIVDFEPLSLLVSLHVNRQVNVSVLVISYVNTCLIVDHDNAIPRI